MVQTCLVSPMNLKKLFFSFGAFLPLFGRTAKERGEIWEVESRGGHAANGYDQELNQRLLRQRLKPLYMECVLKLIGQEYPKPS